MLLSTKTVRILISLVPRRKFIVLGPAQTFWVKIKELTHSLLVGLLLPHHLGEHFTDHPGETCPLLGRLYPGPVGYLLLEHDCDISQHITKIVVHDLRVNGRWDRRSRFTVRLGVLVVNTIVIDRHLYLRYRYLYGSDDADPRRHSNGALKRSG